MAKADSIHLLKSLFRERARWKAHELADRMECDERTVRRYIRHLTDTERWPIDGGKNGYALREPSRAETKLVGPAEVAALVMAHEALRALGSSELAGKLREELMRLCRGSRDLGNTGWQNLGAAIHHEAARGDAVMDADLYGRITLAMLQRQVLDIRYRRMEHKEPFTVRIFPHKWISRDQCWYLIAEDLERGGQRAYALPRVSGAAAVARPAGFVEPVFVDHYEHAFGIWTPFDPDAPLHDVCVELTDYWAGIARERSWHPSQRLEEISEWKVRVHFRVNELVEVKSWVLKFGGAATVIAPPALRGMVLEEIGGMKGNYDL
jgi:predicted DNA-binding transcriptional regulator YafY